MPYVDKVLIVDGGSTPEFVDYLNSLGPKVRRAYRKWNDSFADQYNFFLSQMDGGWVLIQDVDEFPSEELLKSLRGLIKEANRGEKFCCVEFRCNPMSIDDKFENITWDPGPVNHYRQIFFRHTKNLHYTVSLHQSLQGYQNGRILRRDETYYHVKTRQQEFRSSTRNFFIAGIWPSGSLTGEKTSEWHEMKEIVGRHYPEVSVFSDLDTIMVKGNIHPELKDWMRRNKDHPGADYNELRNVYTYYFEFLHPEERE
jgi:glycosyltransferase involved in cell wall biosynthesis